MVMLTDRLDITEITDWGLNNKIKKHNRVNVPAGSLSGARITLVLNHSGVMHFFSSPGKPDN